MWELLDLLQRLYSKAVQFSLWLWNTFSHFILFVFAISVKTGVYLASQLMKGMKNCYKFEHLTFLRKKTLKRKGKKKTEKQKYWKKKWRGKKIENGKIDNFVQKTDWYLTSSKRSTGKKSIKKHSIEFRQKI